MRSRCWPAGRGLAGRQDGCRCRQPRGRGRLQGRVDGDPPVQSPQVQHPRDTPVRDYQPQLGAADGGPLPGPDHGISPRMVAGHSRAHVRDQRHRAQIDDRQQLVADLPGIGYPDVLRQRHDHLPARPLNRVEILKHDCSPRPRSASSMTQRACQNTARMTCASRCTALIRSGQGWPCRQGPERRGPRTSDGPCREGDVSPYSDHTLRSHAPVAEGWLSLANATANVPRRRRRRHERTAPLPSGAECEGSNPSGGTSVMEHRATIQRWDSTPRSTGSGRMRKRCGWNSAGWS